MPAQLKISGDAFDLSWNDTLMGDCRALDDRGVSFLHETAEPYRGLLALGRELFR